MFNRVITRSCPGPRRRSLRRRLLGALLALAAGLAAVVAAPRESQARDYWGGIALSGDARYYISMAYFPSPAHARRLLYQQCNIRATGCRIVAVWRNSCAAFARTRQGGWGTGYGSTKLQAASNAVLTCRRYNRYGCYLAFSSCNKCFPHTASCNR